MATRIATDNLSQEEAAERAAAVTDVSYRVRLEVSGDPARPTFRSSARVGFPCLREATTTFLNLTVGKSGRLREVRVDGSPIAAPLVRYDGARIALAALAAGPHVVEVTADCASQHVGVGLHRVVDPVDSQIYLYTHFEPFDAHKVFACGRVAALL